MRQKVKVCILGGGFAGLYTALYLAKTKQAKTQEWEINLVEPKDNFLFTPLLYEVLTEELKRWEIAPSYQKLILSSPINWIQTKVAQVSLTTKKVILENQVSINYDYLVLAVGRKTHFINIKGIQEYALTFRSIIDAEILKNRLEIFKRSNTKNCRIAIIGAGANGVELACKIYDYFEKNYSKKTLASLNSHLQVSPNAFEKQIIPTIYLVDREAEILKNFGTGIIKAAYKAIKQRKIQLLLSTNIVEIEQDFIVVQQENDIFQHSVDLVLWTAGTANHDWVANLPCQNNQLGQILTLPTLQLIDYPEVLALGDVADIRNNKKSSVPTTAQAAYQQAKIAAKNLQALIQNKPLKHFHYLHLGDMLTLGKGEAIVSSFGINISGKLAGLIRKIVYIQRLPTMTHRWQVLKHWLLN